MAVAFDAAANSATGFPGTSLTWSHTCTGSDLVLIVGYRGSNGASDLVTSITYGGVGLTKVASQKGGDDRFGGLWYLTGATAGSAAVTINQSANDFLAAVSGSYTGATTPDVSGSFTNSGGSITMTLTTVTDNSWLVGIVNSGNTPISAGTGTTERTDNTSCTLDDSNGAKTPTGSYSIAASTTGSGAGAVAIALPPTGGAATPVVKPRRQLTGLGT